MRAFPLILLLALPFVGGWQCASNPAKIDVPKVVEVPVPTLVELDPKLTADCLNEAPKSQDLGEAVRLANVRDDYLAECTKRMRRIRSLQPEAAKP